MDVLHIGPRQRTDLGRKSFNWTGTSSLAGKLNIGEAAAAVLNMTAGSHVISEACLRQAIRDILVLSECSHPCSGCSGRQAAGRRHVHVAPAGEVYHIALVWETTMLNRLGSSSS